MITFSATILRFDTQGEKTGWTYINIPGGIAEQIQPGNKRSFRVKGQLDNYAIKGIALLPMGNGDFIMALNAGIRKAIGKRKGAVVKVLLEAAVTYQLNAAFMECMADEPAALAYFKSLPG